ncbi:MAG TPA: hypothetical protein VJU61_23325 [Polyangiaceae bacterium]|nr:hypothetical protein [Polyangiaceae bacterium]
MAEVSWSVTPLESGDLKLYLRVAARLFLSGSKEEAHDVLSKEGVVHVDSDVWYVASGFFHDSWKEVLTSIGGVGAIWAFGKRLFARRESARQAGFGRSERPPSPSWVRRALKSIRP